MFYIQEYICFLCNHARDSPQVIIYIEHFFRLELEFIVIHYPTYTSDLLQCQVHMVSKPTHTPTFIYCAVLSRGCAHMFEYIFLDVESSKGQEFTFSLLILLWNKLIHTYMYSDIVHLKYYLYTWCSVVAISVKKYFVYYSFVLDFDKFEGSSDYNRMSY